MKINEVMDGTRYYLLIDDDNSGCAWLTTENAYRPIMKLLSNDADDIFDDSRVGSAEDTTAILERLGLEDEWDVVSPTPGSRWGIGRYTLNPTQAKTFIDIASMTLLTSDIINQMDDGSDDYDEDTDEWG